ncbi:MAG TPA: MFS transporter [Vicinamibacteria bacterium]|nr:MFS transporter [Vicinamibacteria bacterium]
MNEQAAHGFHPSTRAFRMTLLVFVGLLTYGSYFAYDVVGALAPTLMRAWHTSQEGIGSLYTAYSVAAIFTVALGGYLADRLGTRLAGILLAALVALGAAIVALAPGLPLAMAGRFLFGAGSESLIVAQSAMLARWFRGKELAFSFGVTLTLSRLGTLFSFNSASATASLFGWQAALWAAVLLCVLSLLCALVYWVMDRRAEKPLQLQEAGAGERIVLADVRQFPASFWYVVMLCVTFYSAIFPFTALSTDFFHEKWRLPLTVGGGGSFLAQVFSDFLHMFSTAPGTTSIIIFASMCLAPFAGGLVDRVGRRTTLMALGAFLMVPCYLVLAFTAVAPRWPMILLGAAFVLVPAAIWPSVALIVDPKRTGTAYGLMTMVQNMGLALFPWLNGRLRVATHDYTASMLMFAGLGVAGLVFALLLKGADRRAGGALERGHARS